MSSMVRTVTLERKPAKRRKTVARVSRTAQRNYQVNTYASVRNYNSLKNDPFPAQMRCVLRYSENVQFAAGAAGTIGVLYWRCNGIANPNGIVGQGHRPYGYNILEQIYKYYRVEKSTCVLSLAQGGAATAGMQFGVAVTNDQVPGSLIGTPEQKGVRMAIMNSGPTQPIQVRQSWKNPALFTDGRIGAYGPPAGVPGIEDFYECFIRQTDPTVARQAIVCNISIEYHVVSWEQKDLGASLIPP